MGRHGGRRRACRLGRLLLAAGLGLGLATTVGLPSAAGDQGGGDGAAGVLPVPTLIAHRGFSARYPENTVLAIDQAAAAGATGVELDVEWSRSNVPFLLHDATLDRATSGTGRDDARWWSYIARQHVDLRPGFAEPIPTMFQALAAAKRAGLTATVEAKTPLTGVQLAAFADRIRWFGFDRALAESFYASNLRALQARDPRIRTALITVACPAPATVQDAASRVVLVYAGSIDGDCVAALHEAGIQVQAWTADTPQEWDRLRAAGVDAVLTDDPAAYRAWAVQAGSGSAASTPAHTSAPAPADVTLAGG